jgi:RNA 2',3'-cyclic 3'-phosphodiesterase
LCPMSPSPSQPSVRSTASTAQSQRLFVAVELSSKAQAAVSGVITQILKSELKNLRAVRPETVHLTLKFLGDVPPDRIDELVEGLRPVARAHAPFALNLSGAGVFPNPKKARVLWLGIDGDRKSLGELHRGIEGGIAALGFARDRKPFNPHLTVARLRESASPSDRSLAAEALASAPHPDGVEIPVPSIAVIRSTLARSGAIHDRLASLPLGL